MSDLPGVTEISRIEIRPGDRIVVKMAISISPSYVADLKRRFADALGLDDPGRIILMDPGMDISVISEVGE